MTKIDEDFAAFQKELERLTKEGDDSLRADLLEMHALSGGKVFTYDDMTQFMRVLSKGGRFKGKIISLVYVNKCGVCSTTLC